MRTSLIGLAVAVALAAPACSSGKVAEEERPAAGPCDPAAFHPTYLPWGKEDPDDPQQSARGNDATLVWTGPSGDGKGRAAVSLVTRYETIDGDELDEFPSAAVRDTRGWLVWVGDPGVGELSLLWEETVDPCGAYELHLLDRSLSESDAEREIKAIAKGLR
jgi:hypothetical protein